MRAGLEEFAAKRSGDQTTLEQNIYPHVAQAIEEFPADTWADDLIREVARQYLNVFHQEGGTGLPTPAAAVFTAEIKATLDKTEDPTQATVDRISVWLATAILNAGTLAATADDDEFTVVEWVTMHDEDVRAAHAATDGQQRPPGETFDVAGSPMRYPGDPTAPIELWINCRCALAPAQPSEADFRQGEGVTMTATETETEVNTEFPLAWHGVLAPEGVWSGDGRQFAPDSLRFRDLPLPLTWQKSTDAGHDGSVVVAKITSIERINGMMQASGTFLQTPEADEVIGLLAEFGRFGVSVDADDAEFEFSETDERITFTSARIASASIVSIPAFAEAYVALGEWAMDGEDNNADEHDVCDPEDTEYDADLCAERSKEPEFAAITLADLAPGKTEDGPGWLTHPVDTDRLRDYWAYGEGAAKIGWGTPGDFNRCRSELAAYVKPEYLSGYCANRHYDATGFWPGRAPSENSTSTGTFGGMLTTSTGGSTAWIPAVTLVAAATKKAPAGWFANPNLTGPTHLSITEEGRVFGHIAEWSACHIGYDGVCVAPPQSSTDYAYFATGQVLLDNGSVARTGVISLGGGHARDGLRVASVTAHYDSTSTAVADVAVGEDEHGIWCAGWVRPGATDEQIIALRASDVSGDWREIRGELELVAALAVNVGGFPTVSVGVENGLQVSLVAAGAVRSAILDGDDVIEELAERVEQAVVARQGRRERMQELAARWERREKMKELAARVGGN